MTQEDLNALIQSVTDKDGKIGAISSSADFFYQKAKDAWEEWKATAVSPDLLEKLIKMDYDEICDSTDSEIVEIRDKMFKLIAYCDSKARDKNKFNECPDKRTIFSHTNIRQGAWLKNLLRYKNGEEEPNSSIKNLIDYLENPYDNFPIMQEVHKGLIFSYFTGKSSDSGSSFVGEIKKIFSPFSQCENEINETAWIASVIYLLKDEWNPQIVEGIFAHNDLHKEDPWQENAVKESAGGYICLSWDKPVGSDIIRLLRKRVENGYTFDFYILGAHAQYKAKVHDISEEGEYDSKYIEWKEYNPVVWLWDNFKTYNNGKAKIVLLADGFEKLKSRIDTSCFKSYRKVNRHMVRQGEIMAYTRILTNNEIKTQKMIDDYVKLLRRKKNVILQGAPGTGKTYSTAEIAVKLIDGEQVDFFANRNALKTRYDELRKEGRIFFTTFHQSLDYEDFVEGMKPRPMLNKQGESVGVEYKVEAGIFKQACESAKDRSVVLIIDEINRGNVSKIFGELITLIESDKREGGDDPIEATLPYSKDSFSVPSNLYIIGTMNTTDRSTGTLDYALRRRFSFVTLESKEEVVEGYYDDSNKELGVVAVDLFQDVKKFIKDHVSGDYGIDDLMVGHSYFMAKDEEELRDKMKYEVIPLIKEYINDGVLKVSEDEWDNTNHNVQKGKWTNVSNEWQNLKPVNNG